MPGGADSLAYALIADVGGTNTRIALADGAAVLDSTVKKYSNREHPSLQGLLTQYLRDLRVDRCSKSAVAIAGPVRNGTGGLTNLKWEINEAELAEITGASCARVLNDLQAQGHALGRLGTEGIRSILPGRPAGGNETTELVIGVGTGFNASLVVGKKGSRLVLPSEAGHADLPVRSDEDWRLSQFLQKNFGHASIEEALSGRGLEHIYQWCCLEAGQSKLADAAEIVANCESDPLARAAMVTMVRLMGKVFGDLALVHLPFGGIYLIGGVARAASQFFEEFGFQEAFSSKGPLSDLMQEFPVAVIEDDFAALLGLAGHLSELGDEVS